MKRGVKRAMIMMAIVGVLVWGSFFAFAQQEEYPKKPITIVVPWAPGGTSSVIALALASELGDYFGVRVLVSNKPGASGAKGTLYVKNARPDGYTLSQAWIAGFAQVPLYHEDPGYDPLKDFYPVAQVSAEPVVAVARKDAPWDTVREFIEDAKKDPEKYNWSGGGALSVHALFFGELVHNAGVDMEGVLYQGATAALPDLLGGTIDVSAGTSTFLALHPEELKAVGVFAEERDPLFPDVPTIKEQGLQAPTVMSWSGIAVHIDTPDEIKWKLVDAFRKILTSKEFKDKMLKDANVRVRYRDPVGFYKTWLKSLEQMKAPIERLKARA